MIKRLPVFLLMLVSLFAAGQNNFASEEELKKEAERLFEEKEFNKAFPLYSQLLSLNQKDPNYSYRFGVCMLFTNADKEKALPYLEKAARDPSVEILVQFYLGRAYHLNYRFQDAIAAFNAFRSKSTSRIIEKYEVSRHIAMCENGKKLLKNIKDLVVLGKKELSRIDFYSSYDLSSSNAKIIVKPDEFKTSYDNKMKEKSVMYYEQGKDELYYSSYGDDGKMGKDIYFKKRLPNGDWSKPKPVGHPVNTEADEDFAFLHPSGNILYFSSKGHNSMGGYDVFKSVRNETTGTWGKPVNMDFAINTPDDDFMFVSDAEDKFGFFASNRSSPDGMVAVYRIQIERVPVDIAIVKGRIMDEGQKPLKAKITVKNIVNNEVVGIFNSKEASGDYLLNLPNGGKFQFIVEAPGYKQLSEVVIIPIQYELKPLGQQIMILKKENGEDVLIVTNNFEDPASDEDYAAVMEILKKRANLDVNEKTPPVTLTPDSDLVVKNDGPKDPVKPISNEDITVEAYNDAKETQKDANQYKKESDQYLILANDKNEKVLEKQKEYDALYNAHLGTTDPVQREMEKQKLNDLKNEINQLTQETVIAYNLHNKVAGDAKQKQEQADFELKYAKDLERALKNNSNTDAIIELNEQKLLLEENMKKKKMGTGDIVADIKKAADEKQVLADKTQKKSTDIDSEIKLMQEEIDRLKKEADLQKNADLKNAQLEQVKEQEEELKAKREEKALLDRKAKGYQLQADSLKNQVDIASTLISDVNSGKQNTSVSVASIDKDKLNKSVNDYQNNLTVSNPPVNDNPVVANPPVTNPPLTVIQGPPPSEIVKQVNKTSDNKKAELDAVNAIPDPVEKEKKKIEIYNNWNETLVKQQELLQQHLDTAGTINSKLAMQKDINKIKEQVKENNKETKKSQDKIEQVTNVVVTNPPVTNPPVNENPVVNNPPVNDNPVIAEDYNDVYEKKIEDSDKITNELEREKAKAGLYAEYSAKLERESDSLKKVLASTSKKDEKKALSDKIALIDNKQGEMSQMADASNDKVEEIIARTNTPVKEPVVFNSPDAENGSKKAIALKIESEKLKYSADSLRVEANATPDAEKKAALIASADKLKIESEKKDIESKQELTKANLDQYGKNDKEINALVTSSGGNSPDLDLASLYHDESKKIFKNAQVERQKGNEEDALKLEQDALIKQQQSIELYKKNAVLAVNNPPVNENPVVTNPPVNENPVVTNPPVNENPVVTNPPVNENPVVTNPPVNENPVVTNPPVNENSVADAAVKELPEYKAFLTIRIESQDLYKEAAKDLEQSDQKRKDSERQLIESQKLIEQTATVTDPGEQLKLLKKSEELDALALKNRQEADSLNKSGKDKEIKAIKKESESESYLVTLPDSLANKIVANAPKFEKTTFTPVVNPPVNDNPVVINPPVNDSPVTNNPPVTNLVDRIVTNPVPVYTPAKPIPLNEKLPEGLVFKVQVGAFRNPINPEIFKGITPLSGETTAQGFTRYTAGIFTSFNNADNAKKQIQNMGFKDAFVVAFYNGKRMNANDALAMINGNKPVVNPPVNDNPLVTNPPVVNEKPNTIPAPPINPDVFINDVKSTNVNNIPGLFFTVQVGFYSKTVTSKELFGITPLNSESIPGGFLRYSSGRYNNFADAVKSKEKIVEAGVKDAFVTAYYQGKRISTDEAANIIAINGKEILILTNTNSDVPVINPPVNNNPVVTNPPVNNNPVVTNPPVNNNPVVTNPPVNTSRVGNPPSVVDGGNTPSYEVVPNNAVSDTGVVFSVLLGEYSGEVPITDANRILKVSKQGIRTKKKNDGTVRYVVGSFSNYETAQLASFRMNEIGLYNLSIVSYKNGSEITIEDAKSLTSGR